MNFYDIKEDWPRVKKRWEAWWDFDLYDRPLIVVKAPRKNPVLPPELADFRREDYGSRRNFDDPGYITSAKLHELYTTYYGGESVPVLTYGGSVGHALTFGCEPIFRPESIWAHELPVNDGADYPEIRFDESNYWWLSLRGTVEQTARASEQRYWSSAMLGNSSGDNLSICRGSERMLLDLVENPDWVRKSVKYISDAMRKQFDALYGLTPLTGLEGYVNYVECWSPKKTHGFDADFSCMISSEMYRDIFLPPLIETMSMTEHRIYHLDGVLAAMIHLDTLLDIDELHAFQWIPGDGRWEALQWLPVMQKMQARRKSVFCYASPDEVIPLLRELRPEGLCISTNTASEDEARRLVERVERMYK